MFTPLLPQSFLFVSVLFCPSVVLMTCINPALLPHFSSLTHGLTIKAGTFSTVAPVRLGSQILNEVPCEPYQLFLTTVVLT